MPVYNFSYAYVVNGTWQFDSRLYELPRFAEKDLVSAQKDAAARHNKAALWNTIVPIAISKLDSPNVSKPKIVKK